MDKNVSATLAIEPVHDTLPANVDSMLMLAVQNSVPIETLERLLALKERVDAKKAKDAFFEAMAKFKTVCPPIIKRRQVMNKGGQTVRFMYASLDDIVDIIQKPLGECGLSYRYETTFEMKSEMYLEIITCIVTHEQGHSERSAFMVPVIFSDAMNKIQSFGSSSTYGQRYALVGALGLSCDEDDDAQATGRTYDAETVPPPQEKGGNGHADIPPDRLCIISQISQPKPGKNNFGIKIDDQWFSTFDKNLVADAVKACNGKLPVTIEYEVKGDFRNITALTVHTK